jgi:hypothetical protein
MTNLMHIGVPSREALRQARALATWRDAELLVKARWDNFLVADGASRRGDTFAAYVAALDAEAAAADDLADARANLAEAA